MLAVIVAGSILFTTYGYSREAHDSPAFSRKLAHGAVGLATVLIAIPLTVTTVDTVNSQEILESAQAHRR